MIVLPFAFKSDGDNHIQAPNPVKVGGQAAGAYYLIYMGIPHVFLWWSA